MRGERRLSWRRVTMVGSGACGHPNRATPLVERVEHIGLAELDPDRSAAWALVLQPLAASIDAAERNFQWHTAGGPTTDEVKCRPDDADQVPPVPFAQIRFDLPRVLGRVTHVRWFL